MNPGLLFSPVRNEGVGLLSIRVAIKTLLMRRATNWLLADEGTCRTCWQYLLAKERRHENLMTSANARRRRKRSDESRATVQADGVDLATQH